MTTARQLHLFHRKRQRGTVPPAANEYQLHCAVVDNVRAACAPEFTCDDANGLSRGTPVFSAKS